MYHDVSLTVQSFSWCRSAFRLVGALQLLSLVCCDALACNKCYCCQGRNRHSLLSSVSPMWSIEEPTCISACVAKRHPIGLLQDAERQLRQSCCAGDVQHVKGVLHTLRCFFRLSGKPPDWHADAVLHRSSTSGCSARLCMCVSAGVGLAADIVDRSISAAQYSRHVVVPFLRSARARPAL